MVRARAALISFAGEKTKPDLAEKIRMVFGVDICVFFPLLALVEANMIGTEFSQAWSDKFHCGQKSVEVCSLCVDTKEDFLLR